ncbi:hypothetical protein NP233_g8408 [Leucocoprinus birnbaumii]|uniref:DUF6699 domain-containing protein n=1 Tax=Leucocoprinus birnbaumii TaxID=56174 RepID=A0AAD5YRW8_9AGAR|nr:hypothetical protein NP233_g8408 [Leucocoprinus birnbaumii]
MSAPYLYTPQGPPAREGLGYRPATPYTAPPGHTPRFAPPRRLPGQHYSPWRSGSPVIPPEEYDYDDDDDDDKVENDPRARYTRGPPGPNNIHPRPDYWRPAYPDKLRPCPLKHLFSTPIHIDPLLRYKKTAHPIRYDLRFSPNLDQIFLPVFHRHPTIFDIRPLATTHAESRHELRLWHRLLPWYITITPRLSGQGITVGDVLEQLYKELMKPITLYDYWNKAMSDEMRLAVDEASRMRARGMGFRTDQAICRIDYLLGKTVFVGLVPSLHGTFEVKTIAVEDSR